MSRKRMLGVVTQAEVEKLLKGELEHKDLLDMACKRIDADPELKELAQEFIEKESKPSKKSEMKLKKSDAVIELSSKISDDAMEGLDVTSAALAKMTLSDLTRVTSLAKATSLVDPMDAIAILGYVYDILGCNNLQEARFKIATALHMLCSDVADEIEKDAKDFVRFMNDKSNEKERTKPKTETKNADPLKSALESILKDFNK